jgi:xanthine dehydrogenase accessory factor
MVSVVRAVADLVATEQLGASVTVVAGPDVGTKAVIDADSGYVAGAIPDDIADDVRADAEALMDHEQNRTLTYGDREVYIETLAPPPILLIFGAGHVAQPLSIIAQQLGFRVIVADARKRWATAERFPHVDELVVDWPDAVFERFEPDRRTYVAVLNHDARFEGPVYPKVKTAPVRYIGAMGSRRTHRSRVERLKGEGWSDDEVDRIHGPIGLDIGAETPEEMAVSILGEIIQARYGHGTGLSLRGTAGRIHAQRGEEEGTA